MRENEISKIILDASIEVHRNLGPGLLESAYESCLFRELTLRGLKVNRQVEIPLLYKGEQIDCAYRADLIVEDKVLVELKSVNEILPIFTAQVLTYLKITKIKLGLLINFNSQLVSKDFHRIVNNL